MINKDSIVLLNKSDVQTKGNHKFNTDTILASVRNNKNIDKLIHISFSFKYIPWLLGNFL